MSAATVPQLQVLSPAERDVFNDLVAAIGDDGLPDCDCHYTASVEVAPALWVTKLHRCRAKASWVAIWTDTRDGVMRTVACGPHKQAIDAGERLYDSRRKIVRPEDVTWLPL